MVVLVVLVVVGVLVGDVWTVVIVFCVGVFALVEADDDDDDDDDVDDGDENSDDDAVAVPLTE